jgi:predicted ATPase/class 3 adenylate cyclase
LGSATLDGPHTGCERGSRAARRVCQFRWAACGTCGWSFGVPGLLWGSEAGELGVGVVELPSGTVTFLFTDIEGSTRLWQEFPDAMQGALARHDEIVRDAVMAQGGHVVKTTGDGFHVAFVTAHDACLGAVDAQRAVEAEQWDGVGALRVRMGLHTGEAGQRDGDYYGPCLNRAARLMSAAHGGQLVCSQATAELVRDDLEKGVELVDLGEHRLRDLARPEHVYEVRIPELSGEFPPLRSLDAYPSNLPSELTSFVGREDQIGQLLADLDRNDLVTLTGTGGVGKTRLAVQACAEALPHFADGAWFVDLAPVRDGDQVTPAVATVLGVKERAGEALAITLRDALRDRHAIVLLDNGEHVVDQVSELLVELRRRPIAATFLITSREPLGIDGEQVRRVVSLRAAEAAELFVQRASSVRSDVDWSKYDADVFAICEQLDGIPLAVELAAARTRSMLPPDILRRLGERFRLLAGSKRTARERHQTLLAAVEWSYDLLTPQEQALFNRLAVFRGGFDLEATEGICAGGVVDELDVVDLLDRLVDKSMVLTFESGSISRYRLLETLRQFAESKLAACDESDEYRDRHVAHFLAFAAEWGPRNRSADQRAVVARLLRERPNINAMLDRLAEDRRWADMAVVCEALGGFWSTMSPEDGRRWCLLLEPHAAELEVRTRIAFLAFSSYVLMNSGFPLDACRCASSAIAEAEAANLEPPPEPYYALTWDARSAGRNEEAVAFARAGAALSTSGASLWLSVVIRMQGCSALVHLDVDAALAESVELCELADRLGVPTFSAAALFGRAFVLGLSGDRSECERFLTQAAELAQGNVLHVQISVSVLRGLLDVEDRPADAMVSLREGIELGERHAVMPDVLANAYEAVAAIWLDRGDAARAAVLMAAVEGVRDAIGARGDRWFAERRERIRLRLTATIPPHEFEDLAARGRAMSRDEIRRFALGEDPEGDAVPSRV